MGWTWIVSKGQLWLDEELVGTGYAGAPGYINIPQTETLSNRGPIPRGEWTMGKAVNHPRLGEIAIPLTPAPTTRTFGRSDFYVHGDSLKRPGRASQGCIILPRAARVRLAASEDRTLRVV